MQQIPVVIHPIDNIDMEVSSRATSAQNSAKKMGTRKNPVHFGRVNTIVN